MSHSTADALITREGENIADGLQRIAIGLEKIAQAINAHNAITAVANSITIKQDPPNPAI